MNVLIAVAVCVLGTEVHAAELIAGPMVGHTTTTSADIWIETEKPAKIQVDYWSIGPGERRVLVRSQVRGQTSKTYPHTGTVTLTGLGPRSRVHYEVRIDGRVIRPLSPQTFLTMPAEVSSRDPEAIAQFMVAFGSCLNPTTQPLQPIFKEAIQHRPVAFLFIGDINYMPGSPSHYETDRETVRWTVAGYHREARHVPEVRALMASTPSYGIWDDHDFGPNDSDRTFKFRDDALDMYRRYWPNTGGGTATTKGVFHSFKIADVEFFMLDDRYHRDPNKADDRSTMFGAEQLDWLKSGLKASTATFKVIANGNSMVVDFNRRAELWDNFGTERDDFFKWIFDQDITGAFFIAGDWHVGTLNKHYAEGHDYPLFELLSSNAGVRVDPISVLPKTGWRNNRQSDAKLFRGYNFGTLSFSGKKGERQVALRIVDEHGKVQIEQVLGEDDLKEEKLE
jgi:alkaline phosphatase D